MLAKHVVATLPGAADERILINQRQLVSEQRKRKGVATVRMGKSSTSLLPTVTSHSGRPGELPNLARVGVTRRILPSAIMKPLAEPSGRVEVGDTHASHLFASVESSLD